LPVDYPIVKVETINILLEQFLINMPTILVLTYNHKNGHPPIFNLNLKKELLSLNNSKGINTLLHKHEKEIVVFPVPDSGVCRTFNTKAEFETILKERN